MKDRINFSCLKHIPVLIAFALFSSTVAYATQFTVTDLGTLGGASSTANGINSTGQVVGYAPNSTGNLQAFLYSNSAMQDLGTLGGAASWANGINDASAVVGELPTALEARKLSSTATGRCRISER